LIFGNNFKLGSMIIFMREFIDVPHQISTEFDTLFDKVDNEKMNDADCDTLRTFIDVDPDYFEPYVLLASYYLEHDNDDECKEIILTGYERAMKRILDDTGRWPDRMEIRHDENVHVHEILTARGTWLWANDQAGAALDLFRNLLRVDPHGDVDASVYILAIRMGYTMEAFGEEFGDGPFTDEVIEWFAEENVKFPDEFWDEIFDENTENESIGNGNRYAGEFGFPEGIEVPSRSGQPHDPEILQLKVTLKGTKPPVWRRILIPDTATFEELHDAIQTYFGWDGDHLHDFTIALKSKSPSKTRKLTITGKPPDGSQPDDARDGLIEDKVQLRDFIDADNPRLTYTYDFGAMNEHAIMLESFSHPEPNRKYPECIKKKGEINMEGEDVDDDEE